MDAKQFQCERQAEAGPVSACGNRNLRDCLGYVTPVHENLTTFDEWTWGFSNKITNYFP